MRTSISDNKNYPEFCKLAVTDDNVFKTFKVNGTYNDILEHVSKADAEKYIDYLKEAKFCFSYALDKFRENDLYGSPQKFEFADYGTFSPTTIRYIKVMYELFKLFGNLDNLIITEVGAGYGGQCKIISDIFNFNKYIMFDLPEVNLLINKYLSKFNKQNIETMFIDKCIDIESDLFISNYAITECSKEIQDIYIKNIIKNAKHGYITCNFVSHLFNISSYNEKELKDILSKYHTIHCETEKPSTFNNNLLIWW